MSPQALSDLDQLAFSVRDKESARLIAEAVAAYRGGALRSAIMSVWIAVAYDIIAKARELATQGEAMPKAFITKLDTAVASKDIKTMMSMETELLTSARDDFQFFAPHEFTDLERLKDDRNLCAHPAFVTEDSLFQPSLELVRTHLVHAIQHLLRHPPLQGKSAIARIETDLLSSSFPTAPKDIETFLRQRYLERSKDSLVISLLRGLLMCPIGGDHSKYAGKERQIAAALASIGRIKPVIYENELPPFAKRKANEVGDDRILAFVRMIAAEPRLWEWIEEAAQIRIAKMVTEAELEQIKEFDLFAGLDIAALKSTLAAKFDKLPPDRQQGIVADNPRAEFAGYAPTLYGRAASFRHAESLGLAVVLPLTTFFTAEHIDKLLAAVETNSQIREAVGSSAIIEKLYDETVRLLPQTGSRWREFIAEVVKGKDRSDPYSYPGVRDRLIAAGVMQR